MNASSANGRPVVGVAPWLPWPFSAWSWWTEPVRAERLAMLRIGIGVCLFADVLINYAPDVLPLFARDSLGDPAVFAWRFRPPRTTWSILRGVGDDTTTFLSLAIWVVTTCWILGTSLPRLLLLRQNPPGADPHGGVLVIWACSFVWYVGGVWSRLVVPGQMSDLAWMVPAFATSLAGLFLCLEVLHRFGDKTYPVPWFALSFALVCSASALTAGTVLAQAEEINPSAWWMPLLKSWQEDEGLLVTAMIVWAGSALFLMLGCFTRVATVLSWMLSLSFENANPALNNAGDTIRLILLFYLMLCPCGATWSVDALWQRRKGPVYVHPWPLRLIFVQMIFIYCMNGIYKIFGDSWMEGNSLYYVLSDASLNRFSPHQLLLLPMMLTRLMTWSVVVWETTFPLLVLWKWSRRVALIFGVLFHLGIFATMELAFFVPYALCMYLPLFPWERWGKPDVPAESS